MKKFTAHVFKLFIASLLFISLPQSGNSSHLMGSDMSYQCMDSGKIKVILKIYRDCRGITLPGTANINVDGPGCGSTVLTGTGRVSIKDVTDVCDTEIPPCTGTNQTGNKGVEEHTYEAIIDFNKAPYSTWAANGCCKVYFSWTSCCRNGAITTGVSGSFYSYAMINICNMKASKDTACNNSPTLANPPVGFACCNQPFTYNAGAVDADLDSLAYSLSNALGSSRTNELSPSSPLSTTTPLTPYCIGAVPCAAFPNFDPPIGFYMDGVTGDIIFTPTKCDEVGVLCIQINEYRKDTNGVYKLIGITRREIQIWVENCSANNPPKVLGPYTHDICEGDKLCFDIKSKDDPVIPAPPAKPQTPDTTFLSWNKGIPGGTFKVKNDSVRERVGEFCWETKIGDASTLPYNFTVTVKDQACPRPAIGIRAYSVVVKKRAQGDRIYDSFPCGKIVFRCDPFDDFEGVPNYLWTLKSLDNSRIYYTSGQKKDSFRFKRGGTYVAELILNNSASCPTVYFDTFTLPKFIEVELAVGDTFVCENDTMELKPRIGYANRPIIYDWSYASTGEKLSTDSFIRILPTKDTSIALFVTDADKCTNTDTVFIHWQALSKPYLGPDKRICTYDTFVISSAYDSTLLYQWSTGVQGKLDTAITVNVANTYWLNTIDSLGCIGTDTFELFVNDTVIANAGPDDFMCLKQSYELKGGIANPDLAVTHQWDWYDLRQNSLAGSTQRLFVSPTDSTRYRLNLQITQGTVMCEDNDTMKLKVNKLPDLTTVRDPSPKCFDAGQFNLGADYPIGANFKWSEKANSDVWYTTQDNRRDTMVRKGTATPNWYYTQRFFNSDMNKGYIPDFPQSDNVYIHVKHNPTGCEDSTLFRAIINKNPLVILNDGVRCQDAGDVRLNGFLLEVPKFPDANQYTWSIDSAPSTVTNADKSKILEDRDANPFSSNYWFSPMDNNYPVDDPINQARLGTYILKFCITDGVTACRTCDSAYLTVEKLPEIQFTPFDKLCYSDDTVNLNDYVNLPQGRWELKSFNGNLPGSVPYANALARMLDSTAINVIDTPGGTGGTYEWRYVNVRTGCPVQDSIEMVVNARPQLAAADLDTICLTSGTIDLLSRVTSPSTAAFAGGGPLTGWSGAGVNANIFDPTSVVTPEDVKAFYGPFTQTVIYQNPVTLCVNNDSIDVIIQAPPVLEITTPDPAEACEGIDFDIVTTTKRTAAGNTWTTNGDGTFDDNTILNTKYTPGTNDQTVYGNMLTITSNQPAFMRNCPIATDSIRLNIHAYPVFTFGSHDSGCTPVTSDFTSSIARPTNHPVTYLWDFGNGQTSTDSAPTGIVFTDEGKYNVKLTVTNTAGGCETTQEDSFVEVYPIPVASIASDPDYYTTVALPRFTFNSTSTITNGGFKTHFWQFDADNDSDTASGATVVHFYDDDTAEYIVNLLVVSDKGCRDSIQKTIKIGPDITVFIPSAFSPDGAGPPRNNKMFVSAQGWIGYNLQIYNRWGERLFESHHPEDEPWDGTYNGEPAQQDVYMYVAKVIAFDGKEYEYSGTITLIR